MNTIIATKAYGDVARQMLGHQSKGPLDTNLKGNIIEKTTIPGFGQYLGKAINNIATDLNATETKVNEFAAKQGNLFDVITSIKETELALETVLSIRDRVIASYEEIMRMPI